MAKKTTARTNSPTVDPTTTTTTAPVDRDVRSLVQLWRENAATIAPHVWISVRKLNGAAGGSALTEPLAIEPADTLEQRIDAALRPGAYIVRLRQVTGPWAAQAWHDIEPKPGAVAPLGVFAASPSPAAPELTQRLANIEHALAQRGLAMPSMVHEGGNSQFMQHLIDTNRRLERDLDEARKDKATAFADGHKKGFDDGVESGKKAAGHGSKWDDPEAIVPLMREMKGLLGRGAGGKDDKADAGAGGIVDMLSLALKNQWAPAVAVETLRTMRGMKTITLLAKQADALISGAREHATLKEWATSSDGEAWLDGLKEELQKAAA